MSNNNSQSAGELISATVAAPENAAPSTRPEWIRLPKPGRSCFWTGLTRSKLNELVLACHGNDFKPQVKSRSLRKAGAIKGVRLIHLQSLIEYIEQAGEEVR